MTGSCLCKAVRFDVSGEPSSIEICHCSKCQRAYGSAFAATLYVRSGDFAWTQGADRVTTWDAPIESRPPAYRHSFCQCCGSPLPLIFDDFGLVEIPVSSFDAPIDGRPAYQMYESQRAPWSANVEQAPWHAEGAPLADKVLQVLF